MSNLKRIRESIDDTVINRKQSPVILPKSLCYKLEYKVGVYKKSVGVYKKSVGYPYGGIYIPFAVNSNADCRIL